VERVNHPSVHLDHDREQAAEVRLGVSVNDADFVLLELHPQHRVVVAPEYLCGNQVRFEESPSRLALVGQSEDDGLDAAHSGDAAKLEDGELWLVESKVRNHMKYAHLLHPGLDVGLLDTDD
jgi:hypothetical protein